MDFGGSWGGWPWVDCASSEKILLNTVGDTYIIGKVMYRGVLLSKY